MSTTIRVEPVPWDTIPGVHVLKAVEAFRTQGVDLLPSLAEFDLGPHIKLDTPLALRRVAAWSESILQAHPLRGVGLIAGGLHNVLDTGIVGYTVLSSETFGEALAERIRFGALLRPLFAVKLHEADDGCVELEIVESEPPAFGPRARAFWMERELASWASASRLILGPDLPFQAVLCAYRNPQLPDRYRETFQCAVRFEQARSLVRIRREVLDRPMRHAHSEAHRICMEQCEALLAKMRAGSGLATTVRRLLLKRPGRLLDLTQTAEALGIGQRTLGRRLAQEGTSFQQVLTEIRMTLAGDYLLGTSLAIADIGRRLGYSDESAFGRAFRRSFGVTPRDYRKRSKDGS